MTDLSERCPLCGSWRWCGRPCKWGPAAAIPPIEAQSVIVTRRSKPVTELEKPGNGEASGAAKPGNAVTRGKRGPAKSGNALSAAAKQRAYRERKKAV